MYTFQTITDEERMYGTSNLMNIIDGFPKDYSEQCVLFQGKLLTVFGEPLFQSVNHESQYDYIIEATDENGKSYDLTVYNGSSGPAIGAEIETKNVEEIRKIARALIDHVRAATPTDFHWEGYYPDTDSKITMGIREGKTYYQEEHITDPDELKKMMELCY